MGKSALWVIDVEAKLELEGSWSRVATTGAVCRVNARCKTGRLPRLEPERQGQAKDVGERRPGKMWEEIVKEPCRGSYQRPAVRWGDGFQGSKMEVCSTVPDPQG